MSDNAPTLDDMSEDLEDLKANMKAFASQLETTTTKVDAVAAAVSSGHGQSNQKKGGDGKDEKPQSPPFILLLTREKFAGELAALAGWVTDLLVPTYLGEISASATWCPSWWEHPAAVARLHALWLAWQELTDPETSGRTGPSVWHRDHLDPAMQQLRSSGGTFAACTTNPDRPHHGVLEPLAAHLLPTRPTVAAVAPVAT